jgi:uncharacterized protein
MVFDLKGSGTYYTRPMPPPGPEPLDIDRLADGESELDFSVSLAEMPRLRSRLAAVGGMVHGSVHFGRAAGLAVAELSVRGSAALQCQRCMEQMEVPIESSARVALIPSEADVSRVPEDLEPMLAPGGRISIRDIVEEELMLTLPIVPLHENTADCTGSSAAPSVERSDQTQRPFERLQELLKRQ